MISARCKGLLALLVVFVAGLAVGVSLSVTHPRWFVWLRPAPPSPGPEMVIRHLTRVLELDAAQQQKVRDLVMRHHPEMMAEIERARSFRDSYADRMFREMEPLLTPEQQQAAKALLLKQRNAPFPPPPAP